VLEEQELAARLEDSLELVECHTEIRNGAKSPGADHRVDGASV